MLDLGDLTLPDADANGQQRMRPSRIFAELAKSIGANFCEHPGFVCLDLAAVHGAFGENIVNCHHFSGLFLNARRCLSNRSSASGTFLFCHRVQPPALSPAISKIAMRLGSKANRMRTSDRPIEPGRSSFMLRCREAVMVSTRGRPSEGPRSRSTSSAALTCS